MKKTLFVSILSLMTCAGAFAQTTGTISTAKVEKDSLFKNWRKKTTFGYWSSYQMTTLKKIDDHSYNNSGVKSKSPNSWYHQFSYLYSLSPKWSYFMKPIFYTTMGNTKDLGPKDDTNFSQMGDWQFGAQYEMYKSHPVSHYLQMFNGLPFSQSSQQAGLSTQPNARIFSIFNFKSYLTLLMWNAFTYNVYQSNVNKEQNYYNNWSQLIYTVNDTWSYQAKLSLTYQHQGSKSGAGHRAANNYVMTQRAMSWGVGYNYNKDINFTPNITMMDMTNVRSETLQLGTWVTINFL